MFSAALGIGLPLLKKYWKPLSAALVALYGAIHLFILEKELSNARATITAFKLVQKREELAIASQNAAVRKLWAQSQLSQKQADAAGKKAQEAILAFQKSLTPLKFAPKTTCEKGVQEFYVAVKEALK